MMIGGHPEPGWPRQYPCSRSARSSYIDNLVADGTNFRVERKEGAASFRPSGNSDADLDAFQSVVSDLRANEGDGYSIHIAHPVSDHDHGLIDLVLVTLDD